MPTYKYIHSSLFEFVGLESDSLFYYRTQLRYNIIETRYNIY